jgi:hypothetical protein
LSARRAQHSYEQSQHSCPQPRRCDPGVGSLLSENGIFRSMIANSPSGRGIFRSTTAISSNGMAIRPICNRNIATRDSNIPVDNRNIEVGDRNCDFVKSPQINIYSYTKSHHFVTKRVNRQKQ